MWLRGAKHLVYLKATGRFCGSQCLSQTSFSSDILCKKSKMAPLQERKMIDRFRLCAKGGDGGNGCTSFRRSRHDRRGRPDGGNGGRGGNVLLECSPSVWDFSSLQHHVNAGKGGHGASKNMIGSRGPDKVVLVPVGTVINLVEGEIPCTVEKSSNAALDPWEIPGSLDGNSNELSDYSVIVPVASTNSNHGSASHVRTGKDFSDRVTKAHVTSSCNQIPLSINKSRREVEAYGFWREETCSEDDYNLDNDDVLSEDDCGEEFDGGGHIHYNVAELTEQGQQIVIAQGGEGGLGNLSSAKCYEKNQNDNNSKVYVDDEGACRSSGLPGSEVVVILELKSIADVGLVGIPNAGKSTLLGAMSRAKPTVGHYAFTTLRPNLGNLNYEDFSITIADIPGLVRGAHENRGLGHAFLRHIERTKVLAYVLDLAAGIDGRKGIPPWKQLKDLMMELEFYREGLSNRPSLVVANKIDEAGAEEVYEELKQRVQGVPIFPVCAVLEQGVPELKEGLRLLVNGGESCSLKVLDC